MRTFLGIWPSPGWTCVASTETHHSAELSPCSEAYVNQVAMGSEARASEATINQGAMGSEAGESEATVNQGAMGSEARGGGSFIPVGFAVNALDAHAPKPCWEDLGAIRAKVRHRIRFAPCLASLCGHACSRATLTCHSCSDWVIRTFTQALDCDSMFPCQYRTQRSQPGPHSTGSPG